MASGGNICHFYNTPQGCWKGDRCRFRHESDEPEYQEEDVPVCRYFSTRQGCRYGDSCCYRHDEPQIHLQARKLEQQKGGKKMSDFEIWKENITGIERPRPDIRKATCMSCGFILRGRDAFGKLMEHYFHQLNKQDIDHEVFRGHPSYGCATKCVLCPKSFGNCGQLMQHIFAKSAKYGRDGAEHMELIERGILEPICFYDVDHGNQGILNENLSVTLSHDSGHGSGTERRGKNTRSSRKPNPYYEMISYGYKPYRHEDWVEYKQLRKELDRANTNSTGKPGSHPNDPDYGGSDSDDDDNDGGIRDIEMEMLSFGLKPYDMDDWDAYWKLKEEMDRNDGSDDSDDASDDDDEYEDDDYSRYHAEMFSYGLKPWEPDDWNTFFTLKEEMEKN